MATLERYAARMGHVLVVPYLNISNNGHFALFFQKLGEESGMIIELQGT